MSTRHHQPITPRRVSSKCRNTLVINFQFSRIASTWSGPKTNQKDWQSSNKSSLEVSSVDEWDQTKAKGWHEAGGVVHLERRIEQEWPFSKPLTLPGPQSLLKLIRSFIITIKEWISCPCSGTLLFNVTCRHITIHSSPFNPHSGIVQWLFNGQIQQSWPAKEGEGE